MATSFKMDFYSLFETYGFSLYVHSLTFPLFSLLKVRNLWWNGYCLGDIFIFVTSTGFKGSILKEKDLYAFLGFSDQGSIT